MWPWLGSRIVIDDLVEMLFDDWEVIGFRY